jgi:hypothetical protein
MGFCPEPTYHAVLVISQRFDFHRVALRDAAGPHVGFIHKYDHAPTKHPAIAVVESVDRCVVLIVTAQCREPKHCRIGHRAILFNPRENQKIGAAGCSIPNPLAWWSGQMEASPAMMPAA